MWVQMPKKIAFDIYQGYMDKLKNDEKGTAKPTESSVPQQPAPVAPMAPGAPTAAPQPAAAGAPGTAAGAPV